MMSRTKLAGIRVKRTILRKVAKELQAKGIERFLFQLDSVGQFDGRWSVYVHESEKKKL